MSHLSFESNLKTSFKTLRLDDLSQVAITSISTHTDRYILCRSFLIRNKIEEARQAAAIILPINSEEDSVLDRLTNIQLDLIEAVPSSIPEFLIDEKQWPEDPFLKGEIQRTLGALYLKFNQIQKAASYFSKAGRFYKLAQAKVLYYESSVHLLGCYLRLNENAVYQHCLNDLLNELNCSDLSVQESIVLSKIKALRAMELEDFPEANSHLTVAQENLKSSENTFEMGQVGSNRAYVLYISKRTEEFDTYIAKEIAENSENYHSEQLLFLKTVQRLRFLDRIGKSDVVELLQEFRTSGVEPVKTVQMIHCLLENIHRQEDYRLLKSVSKIAINRAREMICLNMVPVFTFYRAVSLFQLCKPYQGSRALTSYKLSAKNTNNPNRISKSEWLEQWVSKKDSQTEVRQTNSQFSPSIRNIRVADKRISFDSQHHLSSVLVDLFSKSRNCQHSRFFKVYFGRNYKESKDKQTLYIAYGQIMALMGCDALIFSEDEIKLADHISFDTNTSGDEKVSVLERRLAISSLLKKSSKPLSISDIEAGLSFSRRTLQLDLNRMASDGSIRFSGFRKNRKYFMVEE